ncbi:MAG: hypothetical protein ACRDQW_07900 [Haloechinothrix sp.]
MTQANTNGYTRMFVGEHATAFAEMLTDAATAAGDGKLREAALLADRFRDGGRHLYRAVVRDAVAAGLDWWAIGDITAMHPQAAYAEYGGAVEGVATPAQQRPALAVVLTAGLAGVHDMLPEYGIDVEDLGSSYSITADPKVYQIRKAAELIGEDVWIAITLPGEYDGATGDPEEGVDAIAQWTSAVVDAGELVWVREALELNAADDHDDADDDLDPLD